ncbi:ATP-binding cassette domain-containing protein [Gordonia alkaliphila]|uniref:ATP-binding cassette domain-containing protein n=1 Tax=Gordonia alkaliphila TaxID=1053547 RepID=UPI001FF4EB51|nr:ATP-binding cassette domain-containing protein [Gordonia alkaliphila]MCK0440178.1 ATP-binding cassette domain-containing protein [Gordonia alkaliphila]
MIYSDIAAVTGPAGRRDRVAFVGLTLLSALLQASSVMTLIPVLHALFGAAPSQAWPWVGLLVGQLVATWLADNAAARFGLRVGFGLIDAIETAGPAAIRRLGVDELAGTRAARLRELLATAVPESVTAVVLLGSPLLHALALTPLLSLMLLAVAWQLSLVALVGGLALAGAVAATSRALAAAESAFTDVDDPVLEFAWTQPARRGDQSGPRATAAVVKASRRRSLHLLAWQLPSHLVLSSVLIVVLLVFGAVVSGLYLSGSMSGVTAAAMAVVLFRVVETTGALSLLSAPLASATSMLAQLRALVEAERAEAVLAPIPAPERPCAVTLSQLRFAYPGRPPALDGIDLELPAGSVTAVVGGSGSGKSTLLEVLSGLRRQSAGTVLFDGEPALLAERRARTAVAFADLGRDRVLGKPAGLLLVDDAADPALVAEVGRLRGTRTVVLVTRRPAVLATVDQVVVLDAGRVVETGTFAELWARGGLLADLAQRWEQAENWQL